MPTPTGMKTFSTTFESKSSSLDFDSLKILLASPERILEWSYGEIVKPETIDYRTQKPERDGLFCEKIFGPVKDWECACGKYKKIRYKGVICDKCGVEVTRGIVRRERMGHIKLASPCAHIWFLRSIPSRIALVLDISAQDLEKVIYFANFIIINVKEDLKEETLKQLESEYKANKKSLQKEFESKDEKTYDKKIQELKADYDYAKKEIVDIKPLKIISENSYQNLSLKYGHFFEADIGAEAIDKLLSELDLEKTIDELEKEKVNVPPIEIKRINRRLRLLQSFNINKIKPEWMILKVIPVIPPDLRPMVPLDGGRFASSDLNDLYRRVINRNNRLKKLIELNAPEVITRNEKRMLQEAVDSLIDNSARHTKMVTASTGQKRELKSLADILKGKQGRFRQNLLGKRVDYSGRSVIVVGPHLKLNQCGLPKIMALELFRPFIAAQLIKKGLVHNVRSANRFIETKSKEVWDTLENVASQSCVFLNRAPTLHRLSVQAFQPVLIEGKAIQVHPLVCGPFNADFDGDQMAVHVPLTPEALKETKELMLASKNLLKPATGEPSDVPGQDMVLGAYYMTIGKEPKEGDKIKVFSSSKEASLAYELKKIGLNEKITARIDGQKITTTIGRIIFNAILPEKLRDYDRVVTKKILKKLINQSLEFFGVETTAILLDKIKEITFTYLTKAGLSWGMDDLPYLTEKKEIIEEAEKEVELIENQYAEGLLAPDERHNKIVEIWTEIKNKIAALVKEKLDKNGSVFAITNSEARGSWELITQMMGMKGLVINPQGETIELPIKANFKEGFDVLEYFISTHGGRKGLTDTALRTSSAGYLTRKLIDVAHEAIIQEEDCKTSKGIILTKEEGEEMGESIAERIRGRIVLEDIINPKNKKVILKKNELVTEEKAREVEKLDLQQIKIRSALTCETSTRGVCQKCYGYDLGHNKLVELGTAVGIVAAQSIGEPGTQLTLRTFHVGGAAAAGDITQGLPRVVELLEARSPKKKAILSEIDGKIEIVTEDNQKKIKVKATKINDEEKEYFIPPHYNIWVKNDDLVKKGDQLTEGSLDLYELYNLKGGEAVEKYLLKEIQFIYSSQGQRLNDKHLEVIIRQMFSRCSVKDPGNTSLLPGEVISTAYFKELSKELEKKDKKIPIVENLLLGITKVSLSTDSFLSSASFQETSRVLIDASLSGKIDPLKGLKENVIIGRLIPVGTGFKKK